MHKIIEDAIKHAKEETPKESCGLVVDNKYVPCTNISKNEEDFILDPLQYAAACESGEVTHVVHSHPFSRPTPSQADLVSIEDNNLSWLIVNPTTGAHTITNPSNYTAALLRREFSPGILDCYSLVRDYYKQKLDIVLPNYDRRDMWWTEGKDLYRDNFEEAGFYKVDGVQEHDMIVMAARSTVPNHAGIFIGDTRMMHHLQGKLSCIDLYGGYWRKRTWAILRHKEV